MWSSATSHVEGQCVAGVYVSPNPTPALYASYLGVRFYMLTEYLAR